MEETLGFLRERVTRAPAVILVLGSGLGDLVEDIADPVAIPYASIPGFPRSTVSGHAGRLVAGILEGVEVIAMQGRFHLYEGYPPDRVGFPLRALAALGAGRVILTNAAGGLRQDWAPGDLMLIADHLNLMWRNPLVGPVVGGDERFPDMSEPYDRQYRGLAAEAALGMGIAMREGVYAGVLGPSYETPAEIRMLRRCGADAVGMSTVPEAIVARALGLRVLGISVITNLAAGISPTPLDHEEVLQAGARVGPRLRGLIRAVLPRIAPPNLPSEAAA
jgi:purine-nucleoside phosphorylase